MRQNGPRQKATQVAPQQNSASTSHFKQSFYSDCFARNFVENPYDNALSAYLVMTSKAPRWVNRLLLLRDKIVVPFGMAPTYGFHAHQMQAPLLKCGDTLDFFDIVTIKSNELELQLRDVHFTVLISLYLCQENTEQALYITSIVNTHTWLGKVYVSLIAPFHRLVVRSMLNRLG